MTPGDPIRVKEDTESQFAGEQGTVIDQGYFTGTVVVRLDNEPRLKFAFALSEIEDHEPSGTRVGEIDRT